MKTYLRSICISAGIAALGCSTVFAYNNAVTRSVVLYLDELPHMVTTEATTVGELLEEIDIKDPDYRLDRSMSVDQPVEDMMEIQLLSYIEKVTATTVTKPYTTIKKEVDYLPEGVTNVVQKGVSGKIIKYENRIYYGEELIFSQMTKQEIVQQTIDEIIEVGISTSPTNAVDMLEAITDVGESIVIEKPIVEAVIDDSAVQAIVQQEVIQQEIQQEVQQEVQEVVVKPTSNESVVTEPPKSIEDKVGGDTITYSEMDVELASVFNSLNKTNVGADTSVFNVLQAKVTAYTPYDPGCNGVTYTGTKARQGVIAVDPSIIPLGTKVYIPGYGLAIAEDIGGAIKDNRIDVCFESRSTALEWGVKDMMVYVVVD